MHEEIKTEADIDGTFALHVRKKLKLTQHQFWNPVGVSQSAGCRFETVRNEKMVAPIRILLFARYVAGLDLDASTMEGVKRLRKLAQAQRADRKKKTAKQETAPEQV